MTDIAERNRLFESFVQRAVNILLRFCRERLFAVLIGQVIIEPAARRRRSAQRAAARRWRA